MTKDKCKRQVEALIRSFVARGADPAAIEAAMAHGLFEITADGYRTRRLYTKDKRP